MIATTQMAARLIKSNNNIGVFNGHGQSDFNAVAHAYTSAGIAYHHGQTWATIYGEGREAQTQLNALFSEGRVLTEGEMRDGLRYIQ